MGYPFAAIILYTYYRKGFENNGSAYSQVSGIINPGDFDSNSALRIVLQAFKMDSKGFETGEDSFQEAGEYVYTMSVYKCSDLGLKDEHCKAGTPIEFLLNFTPLESTAMTITVTGDETEEMEPTTPETGQEVVGETVLDCIDVDDPYCALKFLDIFTENFQLCKASTGTAAIGLEPFLGLYRGYEILGVQNNSCAINFWFLKTDDAPDTLLNKQMVCQYGDSERSIEKVASTENCSGPLLKEIDKLMNQMN